MTDSGIEVVWRRDLHVVPNDRSILRGDLLIVPERHTKLCRVDPRNGDTVWEGAIDSVWGWLCVTERHAAYLNQHSHMQCFDLDTGQMVWETDLDGTNGYAVGAGGAIVTGGWRGFTDVTALDATNGERLWHSSTTGLLAHPLAWGDWLALPYPRQERLDLHDPVSGQIVRTLAMPLVSDVPDGGPLIATHGTSLLCAEGDVVWLLDAPDGDWEKRVVHSRPILTFQPTVTGDVLHFEDTGTRLCAYSIESGGKLWESPILNRRRDLLPVVQLGTELTAVGTSDGRVQVLNHDGYVITSEKLGKRITTPLTVTSDGLLVGGTGGELVGLRVTAKSSY